jgi:hypothetical protein
VIAAKWSLNPINAESRPQTQVIGEKNAQSTTPGFR